MLTVNVVIPDINLKVDKEAILDEASTILLYRIHQRFLSETDPTGNPWVPSKAAIARRAVGGTGTLFDTGTLFRSVQVFKHHEGQRTIGTDVDYAEKHQLGLDGMIPRPFLGFNEGDTAMVQSLLNLRISEFVKVF